MRNAKFEIISLSSSLDRPNVIDMQKIKTKKNRN